MIRGFSWLLLMAGPSFGHDVITTKLVWTQEISRIVFKHCASCHRDGGRATSLMTYEEARPWAKAIRDEVLARRMPPWGAVKGVGQFRDDPSLSQIEIDMIVNWVEGGAPKGDEKYLPPAPRFATVDKPLMESEVAFRSGAAQTLDRAISATGLRPRKLAPGAWLDVTAAQPNGTVEHLIWIRGWRPEWARTFHFLHPLRLGPGTRITVYSDHPAEAALTVEK